MEIQLINSEKFFITQQDEILYSTHSGTYNGVEIESLGSPDFVEYRVILFLRGDAKCRDGDSVKVPREKMKQVLTALSLCCIYNGVTLTVKL